MCFLTSSEFLSTVISLVNTVLESKRSSVLWKVILFKIKLAFTSFIKPPDLAINSSGFLRNKANFWGLIFFKIATILLRVRLVTFTISPTISYTVSVYKSAFSFLDSLLVCLNPSLLCNSSLLLSLRKPVFIS